MPVQKFTLTEEQANRSLRLGTTIDDFHHQCHNASHALIRGGALPLGSRVARGTCEGVPGQHSWVVLGSPARGDSHEQHADVYADDAVIVDITAWSYRVTDDDGVPVPKVWITSAAAGHHRPHGKESIWAWGCPQVHTEDVVHLDGLSAEAQSFVSTVASTSGRTGLDVQAWYTLLNAPVQGWPAAEIVAAAYRHPRLHALAPIDIVGMLTEINPGDLYF